MSKHDLNLMEKLSKMPDSEIDYSDIPPVREYNFQNRSGALALFRPIKQQITLRLDGDIIAWAKQNGDGYQTRINAALRKAMIDEIRIKKAAK